jgi:hypothetical protein
LFAVGPYVHELYFPTNVISQRVALFSINGFIDLKRESNGPVLIGGRVGHEISNIDFRSIVTWRIAGVGRRAAATQRSQQTTKE